MALQVHQQAPPSIIYNPTNNVNPENFIEMEPDFFSHFDMEQALQDVLIHCDTLPSSANVKQDRYARIQYEQYIRKFIDFLKEKNTLPNERVLNQYIGTLRARALSHNTITTYLPAVRWFIKKLANQSIDTKVVYATVPDGNTLSFQIARLQLDIAIQNKRTEILGALQVSNPRPSNATHRAKKSGTWITYEQFKEMTLAIDLDTLAGKRDYAMLLLFYFTGLRRAAVARIRLSNFNQATDKDYLLDVMDKRRNVDEISCRYFVYEAIKVYVNAYNEALGTIDNPPPPIGDDDPVWRPLSKTDMPYSRLCDNPNDKRDGSKPLSKNAIYRVVNRRSMILGTIERMVIKSGKMRKVVVGILSPHDLRRSIISEAHSRNMPLHKIQEQARHGNSTVTEGYIEKRVDASALSFAALFVDADRLFAVT